MPVQPVAFDPVALWSHLFGDAHGLLCIASGPRVDGKLARVAPMFYHWPGDGSVATDYALTQDKAGFEVYFCAHLLDRRTRRKESAAPITALYADADGPVDLRRVPPPTATVLSSAGCWHLYWALSRPLAPPMAEDLNRRLTYEVGADRGCWNLGRLLRVPGTSNHKRDDGHVVTIQTIIDVAYDPDDFEALSPGPIRGRNRHALLGPRNRHDE